MGWGDREEVVSQLPKKFDVTKEEQHLSGSWKRK